MDLQKIRSIARVSTFGAGLFIAFFSLIILGILLLGVSLIVIIPGLIEDQRYRSAYSQRVNNLRRAIIFSLQHAIIITGGKNYLSQEKLVSEVENQMGELYLSSECDIVLGRLLIEGVVMEWELGGKSVFLLPNNPCLSNVPEIFETSLSKV